MGTNTQISRFFPAGTSKVGTLTVYERFASAPGGEATAARRATARRMGRGSMPARVAHAGSRPPVQGREGRICCPDLGPMLARRMALSGIAGKIALVTGAARRRSIGRATALRLAREGADVACLDIARPHPAFPKHPVASADELDEVVREIQALGRRAVALRADVSSWDEVHAAVADTHAGLGAVDLCCNIAGGAGAGMGLGPLLQIGEHEWDRVLDVNLKGTWMVARACAERMLADGRRGRIVNVSSQA